MVRNFLDGEEFDYRDEKGIGFCCTIAETKDQVTFKLIEYTPQNKLGTVYLCRPLGTDKIFI